jgi:serine phosphatase RsbU (regulator of sigma subunit)
MRSREVTLGSAGRFPGGLGLKAKFMVWLALFVPGMMLVTYLYFSRHEQAALAAEIQLRGRAICNSLASGAEDPLVMKDDLALAKLVADAKAQNQGVVYCFVIDARNNIWAHSDLSLVNTAYAAPPGSKMPAGGPAGTLEYRTPQGIDVFDISLPITVGRTVIGEAHVAVSRESIRRAIARARRGIALVTAVIMAIGIAGILALVSFIIGSLSQVTADIEAIGNGDLDRRIATVRRDEVGKIALAVKAMAAKLKLARERLIEQERMKKELQIARDIQTALLPTADPALPGLRVASYYRAATEVGGDYYDFIETGGGRLGVVVADVSGKGVAGSMVMTMLRSIIRLEAGRNASPHDLVCAAHAALKKDIPEDMFVTLFYAVLDPGAGRLRYCCAGHNPAYLYSPGTGALRPLKSGGQPLGVSFFDEQAFSDGLREETQAFNDGDVFVVYTDGVTEAANTKREQFGEERVEEIIRRCGRGRPEEMRAELAARIEEFTGREPQADDITFVIAQNRATGEGA